MYWISFNGCNASLQIRIHENDTYTYNRWKCNNAFCTKYSETNKIIFLVRESVR